MPSLPSAGAIEIPLVTGENYIIWTLMLKWFRPGASPYQTALAMIGAKSGDRALTIGQPDPQLTAELARITGLNGQTLVANQTPAQQAAIEAAAGAAGTLVEFGDGPAPRVPGDDASTDLVLISAQFAHTDPAIRTNWLAETFRVLRPGGRVILLDGARQTGLFASKSAPTLQPDMVIEWIMNAGGRAARQLAVADGIAYYEARKARE
jgi:ubiquinone/menaquinone biosynthesis C-methylase UbiE